MKFASGFHHWPEMKGENEQRELLEYAKENSSPLRTHLKLLSQRKAEAALLMDVLRKARVL